MAETLVELVAKISADTAALQKGLADADKDTQSFGKKTDKETKSISDAWKTVGKSFVVVGATITASMTMIVKSFTDTGSELHDLSLKTGVSVKALAGLKYAAEQNGASLGTVEMAIRRTSSAMEDAKDGLSASKLAFDKLGLSLTDLAKLNPEEQFMAIAGALAGVETQSTRAALAQDLFGRSGMDMLPMLSQGADGLKKMMAEGAKYSGWTTEAAKLADDFGDSLGTLKTAVSGVFVAIGSNLVPKLQKLVDNVTQVIGKMTEWSNSHPELTSGLSLLAIGIGVVFTATGGLILAIPKLIAAWRAFNLAFTTSPLGLIVLALTAVGIAIYTIIDGLDKSSDSFKRFEASVTDSATAQQKLTPELERGAKAFSDLIKPQVAKAMEKTAAESKKAIDTIKQAIEDLRNEYGDLGNAIKSKGDMARAAAQVAKDALDSELSKARESTEKQLGFLAKLYAEKIRLVNAGATQAIKGIQDQIDAIDKQTELENQALEDKRDKDSLAKLSGKERTDFLAEMERKLVLRQRELDKEALRNSIETVREDTQNKIDKLNEELEKAQQTERDRLAATEERIKKTNISLDVALDKELKRLAIELKDAEKLEIDKLALLDKTLAAEELKTQESYDKRLAMAKSYQNVLYSLMGGGELPTGQTGMPIPAGGLKTTPWGVIVGPGERATGPGGEVFIGQHGGIVTQPTMSLIGEAGPEAVIPLNEAGVMGGITINFTQPVFFDREDTMNKFVDMIRKGIQRQDRLRFGGAYAG